MAAKKSSSKKEKAPAKAKAAKEEVSSKEVKEPKAKAVGNHGGGRMAKVFAMDAFQKLKKEHGKVFLTSASDRRVAQVFRIPTGIFPLDTKLGGGLPQGRVITFFGMKSSGKTTALTRTLASAQRMCSNCWEPVMWSHQVEKTEAMDEETGEIRPLGLDAKGNPKTVKVWEPVYVKRWWADTSGKWRVMLKGVAVVVDGQSVPQVELGEEIRPSCACGKYREAQCAFIDVEGTFDKVWARRHGVDLLKLIFSQPEAAEHSLDIADALVRSGECDLLVLDSIAFLTPEQEIVKSTSEQLMGVQARTVGKGVRKFVSGLNAVAQFSLRRPTILLTNQIRMKIGVVFGNPETTSAGLAPGFAASVEVRTRAGEYTFKPQTKDEDKNNREPLSVSLNFEIEKDKTNTPKRRGTYEMALVDGVTKHKGDILDDELVFEEAKRLGVIQSVGGAFHVLGEKFSQVGQLKKHALSDPLFAQKLRWATLKALMAVDSFGFDDSSDDLGEFDDAVPSEALIEGDAPSEESGTDEVVSEAEQPPLAEAEA